MNIHRKKEWIGFVFGPKCETNTNWYNYWKISIHLAQQCSQDQKITDLWYFTSYHCANMIFQRHFMGDTAGEDKRGNKQGNIPTGKIAEEKAYK